ncbi:MAG: ABC transporter permease, partial [Bryobacteraceae bacterium]
MTLSDLRQDGRYALRMLRRSPVFTAVAVSSLALGIGANTAIFTLIDAILLRWLPVQNPQELVVLARNPPRPSTSFNYPDYRYIRDNNQSYTGLIAFSGFGRPVGLTVPGKSGVSQLISLSMVSGIYFDVLGVTPSIGRLFNPADNENEGAHPYVILSHAFWRSAFGEDTGIIGSDLLLNGNRFQVIGVAREGFTGPTVGVSPDMFVPIIMYRTFQPTAHRWNTRNMWWLTLIGRLKPGVTPERAGAELNVLWQRILEADPNRRPVPAWDTEYKIQNTATLLPGSQGHSYLRTQTSKPLTILMITVALVLVIACANVANLLLARGIARRKEIAVRLAVGAARGRLIAQMLTESITLSMLGGIAGLAVAWAGVRVLLSFLPTGPFAAELNLSPDLRLLGFAFGLSLLSGVIFGLVPALRSSRPELVPALKSDASSVTSGRAARWDLRRSLVCLQVALSLILLAGAGLFVRTLANLRGLDPGMNRENLLFVETNVGQFGYQPQQERVFEERLREDVQRLPGVRAASVAAITPLSGSRWNGNVQIEGYKFRPDERPYIDMNAVTPRYFEAAGIPIVLGRDFRESDSLAVLPNRPDPPPEPGTELPDPPGPPRVVIVNEAFVRRFFGGESPTGRRLCFGEKWNPAKLSEIVGVVRDARYFDLREDVEPMIYQPRYRERGAGGGGVLCVRTTGDPSALIEEIRGRVQDIDSAVSVTDTRTMEDNLNRNLLQERFVAMLGSFFGVVALLLAAIGLYGVMSQAVTRRTREIGIRMALGAQSRKVLWMVLREALVMVSIGAILGIAAALALTRYTESMLFGIKPQDPLTLAATGLLL